MKKLWIVLLSLFLLTGCGQKPETPVPPSDPSPTQQEPNDLMGGSPDDPLTGTNEKGEYLSFFVAAGGGADSYAVSWRYPAEAAEGFGARLPTIAETFLAS